MAKEFKITRKYIVVAKDIKASGRKFIFKEGMDDYGNSRQNHSQCFNFWDDFVLPEWCDEVKDEK